MLVQTLSVYTRILRSFYKLFEYYIRLKTMSTSTKGSIEGGRRLRRGGWEGERREGGRERGGRERGGRERGGRERGGRERGGRERRERERRVGGGEWEGDSHY